MDELGDFLLFRSACRKTDASIAGQKNACEDAREESRVAGTGSIDSQNLLQTIMTEQELQQYLLSNYSKENEGCEWKEFNQFRLDVEQ